MRLCRFAVWVMFLSSLWAQETPGDAVQPKVQDAAVSSGSQRPRIGLVLEGGGALGLAHVGVIRWLEENHIPVDVIAGTSMGALVGGIYATGNRLARSTLWSAALSGTKFFEESRPIEICHSVAKKTGEAI